MLDIITFLASKPNEIIRLQRITGESTHSKLAIDMEVACK